MGSAPPAEPFSPPRVWVYGHSNVDIRGKSMRVAAAVVAVVLGAMVLAGCTPPAPVPLVEPAAGCYRSARSVPGLANHGEELIAVLSAGDSEGSVDDEVRHSGHSQFAGHCLIGANLVGVPLAAQRGQHFV